MKIQIGDYTLQPGLTAKDRFDLLKRKQITMNNTPMMVKKYGNVPVGTIVGEKDEEIAYDLNFDTAIRKIILYYLAEDKDTTDLRGFITAYKKQVDKVEELVKL